MQRPFVSSTSVSRCCSCSEKVVVVITVVVVVIKETMVVELADVDRTIAVEGSEETAEMEEKERGSRRREGRKDREKRKDRRTDREAGWSIKGEESVDC